jgi:hypothetical protein
MKGGIHSIELVTRLTVRQSRKLKVSRRFYALHVCTRFGVAVNSVVLWEVMPWSTTQVLRRFGGMRCLHLQGRRVSKAEKDESDARWLIGLLFNPEDGGNLSFRNVCQLLQNYVTSDPKNTILHV